MTDLQRIHALVARATLAVALSRLLACAPETVGPTNDGASPKTAAGASGLSGRAGSAAGASASSAESVASAGATSAVAVGVAAAPTLAPGSAGASTAGGAGAAAQTHAANGGPTTAFASLSLLTNAKPASGAAAHAGSGAAGVSATSAGLPSPPNTAPDATVPEELCTRLRQATQSAPGLALRNPRIGALVAACAAAQPTTSSGSAGAGSAAAGSGPAATGDAPSAASTTGSFDGTAVFTRAADGVDLLIVLDGCKDAALYPVHIHEGHSCSSAMSLGEHWDRPRGEDIPDLRCSGSHVAATYTRLDSEPKSWSLGGPSASDVIGHVLVVNDPDDRTLPVACGVIQAP